jgi:hypothetical protein
MSRAMPRRLPPVAQVIRVRAFHCHDDGWVRCFCCEQTFQLGEMIIEVSHETEHLGYLCSKCQWSTAAQLRPRLFKLAADLDQKAEHIRALALLDIIPLEERGTCR